MLVLYYFGMTGRETKNTCLVHEQLRRITDTGYPRNNNNSNSMTFLAMEISIVNRTSNEKQRHYCTSHVAAGGN
jgi:hypothetical protein